LSYVTTDHAARSSCIHARRESLGYRLEAHWQGLPKNLWKLSPEHRLTGRSTPGEGREDCHPSWSFRFIIL